MAVKRDSDSVMSARSIVCVGFGALFLSVMSGCTTASLNQGVSTPSSSTTPSATGTSAATAATPAPAGKAGATPVSKTTDGSKPKRRQTARRKSPTSHHPVANTHRKKTVKTAERDRGTATKNADFVDQGTRKGGEYPKFVPPKAATSQMSDAEKSTFEAQMAARMKANNDAGGETAAESAEHEKLLRALAAKHGQDTLKQIEK